MTTSQQNKGNYWTGSKSCAIGLLIFLGILTFAIAFTLSSWTSQNNELQQSRTFHIVYGFDFNGTPINVTTEHPDDVDIDLTVTYPRSILVVNDKVTLTGLAVVYAYPPDTTVLSFTVGFENSQTYPPVQTDGITNSSNLFLNEIGGMNRYNGTTDCTWEIEGTYRLQLAFLFKNSTGTFAFGPSLSSGSAITVYPKTDLAQILTNNASTTLTIAIYALTVVGTLSLFVTLWDRKPTKTDGDKGAGQTSSTTDKHQ